MSSTPAPATDGQGKKRGGYSLYKSLVDFQSEVYSEVSGKELSEGELYEIVKAAWDKHDMSITQHTTLRLLEKDRARWTRLFDSLECWKFLPVFRQVRKGKLDRTTVSFRSWMETAFASPGMSIEDYKANLRNEEPRHSPPTQHPPLPVPAVTQASDTVKTDMGGSRPSGAPIKPRPKAKTNPAAAKAPAPPTATSSAAIPHPATAAGPKSKTIHVVPPPADHNRKKAPAASSEVQPPAVSTKTQPPAVSTKTQPPAAPSKPPRAPAHVTFAELDKDSDVEMEGPSIPTSAALVSRPDKATIAAVDLEPATQYEIEWTDGRTTLVNKDGQRIWDGIVELRMPRHPPCFKCFKDGRPCTWAVSTNGLRRSCWSCASQKEACPPLPKDMEIPKLAEIPPLVTGTKKRNKGKGKVKEDVVDKATEAPPVDKGKGKASRSAKGRVKSAATVADSDDEEKGDGTEAPQVDQGKGKKSTAAKVGVKSAATVADTDTAPTVSKGKGKAAKAAKEEKTPKASSERTTGSGTRATRSNTGAAAGPSYSYLEIDSDSEIAVSPAPVGGAAASTDARFNDLELLLRRLLEKVNQVSPTSFKSEVLDFKAAVDALKDDFNERFTALEQTVRDQKMENKRTLAGIDDTLTAFRTMLTEVHADRRIALAPAPPAPGSPDIITTMTGQFGTPLHVKMNEDRFVFGNDSMADDSDDQISEVGTSSASGDDDVSADEGEEDEQEQEKERQEENETEEHENENEEKEDGEVDEEDKDDKVGSAAVGPTGVSTGGDRAPASTARTGDFADDEELLDFGAPTPPQSADAFEGGAAPPPAPVVPSLAVEGPTPRNSQEDTTGVQTNTHLAVPEKRKLRPRSNTGSSGQSSVSGSNKPLSSSAAKGTKRKQPATTEAVAGGSGASKPKKKKV